MVVRETDSDGVASECSMKRMSLKIVDLNPDVPEDDIHDLLCEKFSKFPDVRVNVSQERDAGCTAYIEFKTEQDARVALKENSCVVLFGYACRTMPCPPWPDGASMRPDSRASSQHRTSIVDEYHSSSPDGAADDDHREYGSPESLSSEPRYRGSFRAQSWRGGRGSRRGARGFGRGSSRGSRGASSWTTGRGRGKPYVLTSHPSRGGQKPYLLTAPTDREKAFLPNTPTLTDDKQKLNAAESEMTEKAEGETARNANNILYIGSMDPVVQAIDLKRLFSNFGFVLDVEIKKPGAKICYAFVHFLTMDMAQLAIKQMEGKLIGHTVPKLGYGRPVEACTLWVGGLGPWTSVDLLRLEFSQFGEILSVNWPRNRDYAYVEFASMQDATDAQQVLNGSQHGDPPHGLRICYATALQLKSNLNNKLEFPQFPKPLKPKSKLKPQKVIRRSPETRYAARRRSRSREFREHKSRHSAGTERWSRERRRSRSHSGGRRKSRELPLSRKRERSHHSAYGSSISDDDLSNISETSSDSSNTLERNKSRKRRGRHRKQESSSKTRKSPGSKKKLLRNASPLPALAGDSDERTVVLRSEAQSVNTLSVASPSVQAAYPAVLNPQASMHPAAMPPYVPNTYYPPPVYPPPLHIPPPDIYMPPNPLVQTAYQPPPQPQLVPYADVAGSQSITQQPVPLPAVAPITHTYMPDPIPVQKLPPPDVVGGRAAALSCGGVAAQFPKVWSGALVLRNAAFVVDLHLVSGSVLLANSLLGKTDQPGSEVDCPVLKIAQRLRLDQPDKLDELSRRLKKAGRVGCSVLLATSAGAQVDDDANVVQQYPLSSLVSYLLQKQVAAVVSLPPASADATGVLHAFPPCQFATEFLDREAPGLPGKCPSNDELLVVLCHL